MTMTDTILFVKETKTCHYVMVIHTPRLCGEPGFKTRLEQREEAFIRCREILDSPDAVVALKGTLPESSHPIQRRVRNPVISPPPPPPPEGAADPHKGIDRDAVKRALEAFLSGKSSGGGGNAGQKARNSHADQDGAGDAGSDSGHDDESPIHITPGEDGEMIIEFLDFDGGDAAAGTLEDRISDLLGGKLQEMLRAAGMEVFAVGSDVEIDVEQQQTTEDDREEKDEGNAGHDRTRRQHEEL